MTLSLVQKINYITQPFRPFEGWVYRGLVETPGETFGLEIEGKYYAACFAHHFEKEVVSEYESTEQKMIDDGKVSVALFYGMDNTSYVRRFTPNEFLEFFAKPGQPVYVQKEDDLYYNS